MTRRGTLLIGQSGGATAVINASLVGVIEGALASARFGQVLGMRHGIEGLLTETFLDLGAISSAQLDLVRRTPSAALGTSRHKVTEEDLDLALQVLRRWNITAVVYIGGNDSADTAHRLHERAMAEGDELTILSVPKTIDNDLPETDHCPGYGSIARFLANAVRDATYDTIASPQLYPVKFVEVMGRDAGWVPASGILGFDETEADLLPLVYVPERPPADAAAVLSAIEQRVRARGWVVAVVPETLHDANGHHLGGDEPEYIDSFGHPYHASVGATLTRLVTQQLGLRARCDKPGTIARMAMALASAVDLDEAYQLGWSAAWKVAAGERDVMVTIQRISDEPYTTAIGTAPLVSVANQVRLVPDEFLGPDGTSLTAAYHRYAWPLLGPDPVLHYARLVE